MSKTAKQLIDNLIGAAYNSGYYSGKKYDVSDDPNLRRLHTEAMNLRGICANEILKALEPNNGIEPPPPLLWHFKMTSEEYGTDEFWPYDYEEDAEAGIKRIQDQAAQDDDGVERWYSAPYVKEE